jgi:hypothetical protein
MNYLQGAAGGLAGTRKILLKRSPLLEGNGRQRDL